MSTTTPTPINGLSLPEHIAISRLERLDPWLPGDRIDAAGHPQVEWPATAGAAPHGINWARQIVPARSGARCPNCNAVVYSRRHKLCGACGEALPGELLFSQTQVRQVEELLSTERHRHRAWMKRERSW